MKKFFLFAVLFCFINTFANEDIKSINNVNFYGVDFSHANLFGLEESPAAIKSGLERINNLFIKEKKKYNLNKFFKKNVDNYCMNSTDSNNAELSIEEQLSNAEYIELSNSVLQTIVAELSCNSDGYGLVMIAENLNKKDKKATYLVVFFDEKTKEIIYSKRATGKAYGFGIRNHWAKSIYNILKKWKY